MRTYMRKNKPLRHTAAYILSVLLNEIRVHNFTVKRGMHIGRRLSPHRRIEFSNYLPGHLCKLLLLPVDHLTLQRQGKLHNSRGCYHIGIHSFQLPVADFVGVAARLAAAVAKYLPVFLLSN